jgi:hypothetical protein
VSNEQKDKPEQSRSDEAHAKEQGEGLGPKPKVDNDLPKPEDQPEVNNDLPES